MQSPRICYLGDAHGVSSPAALIPLGHLVGPRLFLLPPHQLNLIDDLLAPRPLQRISLIPTASLQSAHPPEESIVQVHARCFLHNARRRNPDGTCTAPRKLSNEERKRRITEP
jgi:hypothetical protein